MNNLTAFVTTPGSSMEQDILEEAEFLISGMSKIPKERAEYIEDSEHGTLVRNAEEANDQRILEMQLVLASKGWGYIVELWNNMIDRAEKEMKNPKFSDEETVTKKREWLALQKAIIATINAVENAANIPLSEELPR